MEGAERRGFLLLLAVAVLLAFYVPGVFTSAQGEGWQVVVYIIGLACVAGAGVLLLVALAPWTDSGAPDKQQERLLFFALGLVVADVLSVALLRAYAAYYLHKHGIG